MKSDQTNHKAKPRATDLQISPADDLLIVELDQRMEMAAALLADDTNTKCNDANCPQNGACPKSTL